MANISSPEGASALVAEKLLRPPIAGTREAEIFESGRIALASEADPLAVLAGRDVPSREMIENINRENIGRRNNAGGRRLNTEETVRLTRANELAVRYSQIVRGENIHALAGNAEIVTLAESMISQNPNLLAAYTALPPADRTSFIESYLTSPTTRSEIANLLKTRVTVETIIGDDIAQKTEVRDRLDQERQALEAERTRIEGERTVATTELQQYESTVTAGVVIIGDYAQSLSIHESNIAKATSKIADLTASTEAAQRKLEVLSREKSIYMRTRSNTRDPLNTDITDIFDNDIETLTTEISTNRTNISTEQRIQAAATAKRDAIKLRGTSLNTNITEATKRIKEIEDKLNGKEGEDGILQKLTKARSELSTAIATKRSEEHKYLSELESILPEAIHKTMQKELERVGKAEATIDTQARARAKTDLERNIRESMTRRYQLGDEINWINFRADYITLLTQGEDTIITGLLPAGTTIDAFRNDNPTEYAAISSDIKQKLLRLRLQEPRAGGRLRQVLLGPNPVSRGETLAIVNRFGELGFTEALKTNKAFRDVLAQGDKDKVLNLEGKVTERIKKLPLGKILLALAALLGIGIFKGAGT